MSDKEAGQRADHLETTTGDNASEIIKQTITVDTLHNDEAMKVLGNARTTDAVDWDEDEERRLVRKLDWKLMPLLFLTFGLQFYDKALLSSAALFGMREDLNLTGNRYNMSSSIFYLGYIAGALPTALLAQRFKVERVAAGLIFVWGACCTAAVGARNFQTLYIQRFFLGFLESGISPIFMVMVSSFYKKDEQAWRQGIWFSASAFISVPGPLINYGLGHITGSLAPWKYMFIVAGCLTMLWSIVVYFFMPPDPIRAKGFTERERFILVARLRSNNTGVRNTHFKAAQLIETLADPRFLLTFAMAFLIFIVNGPVSTFMPLIIASFGYSGFNSLLLSIPVGAFGGVSALASAYLAHRVARRGWRTWVMIAFLIPAIVGSVLLWQVERKHQGPSLLGIILLGGFASPYGILMGIQTANTAGYTKRSVTAAGIFVGYCLGNFTGPLLFKPEDAPGYAPGFLSVLITSIAAGVLAVGYRYICVWENHKRDKSGVAEGFEHAYDDDVTDIKNPQFRYNI
ncbi:MFS transporter [Eremomyces bilateralis CBS 781.70]|uniref:MFS transporter n=1 Tax=Eremomyces bilateralis CBS 781.70 TaxID=1392243 RepID=A0A6G1G5K4_9PEZI|nr:MFS transporter [Eremomyces bilateralis CBS 781.70]KAF1813347.1 MFS transporter [Eremomyces bilateralis CBS 781.70]